MELCYEQNLYDDNNSANIRQGQTLPSALFLIAIYPEVTLQKKMYT